LKNFNSCRIKTIIFDNGKEYSKHTEIAKYLNVNTYSIRPYTSQDKGTLGNRIDVIKDFFKEN